MFDDSDNPLPPGKLPGELLAKLIHGYVKSDSSLIVGPGIGRDAAVIDLGDRLLVVKTDPITFKTVDAGRYLVNVNANDVACMGGVPRWLLVTALLPERSTTSRVAEDLFASLARASSERGIVLAGGHSEITIGLDRPLLVGMMIGETTRERLVDPTRAKPGDAIILAGGIAIEGTSILATAVDGYGIFLDADLIERSARLIDSPGISVGPAVTALLNAGVDCRCLHDPTEGGLATALAELATATDCGLHVDYDRVPILPETSALCLALGLDPLGLIASGSLLVVVTEVDAARSITVLRDSGIVAERIGTLLSRNEGTKMVRDGVVAPLPEFEVDEIARFFASCGDSA